jgi:hypothetical protein
MTTDTLDIQTHGDWQDLGDDNHQLRLLGTQSGQIFGGVLKHYMKGTTELCEPGLIQWEPYGEPRPLFERTERKGRPLSLVPFIHCSVCGDMGFIIEGQWVPKEDEDGIDTAPRVPVLESTNHTAGHDSEAGGTFDFDEFRIAVRRDQGDTVPEEEELADRRLVDVRGGPDVIISTSEEDDDEEAIVDAIVEASGPDLSPERVWPARGNDDGEDELRDDEFEDDDDDDEGPSDHRSGFDRRKESLRKSLLDEAANLILGDRNNAYGPPHQDFQRTADMVSAMWADKLVPGARIEAHDVAEFIICVKLSRLQWTPEKRDNWTDIVGYAGCGYEAFRLTHPDIEEK